MDNEIAVNSRLSFIHISDIHFNSYSNDQYDIDTELRDAMLNDLKKYAVSELINVNGVLVCGDLAFSGKNAEYDKAKCFLQDVNEIFHLEMKDVFCVPGNHDIDQSVIRNSRVIECLQDFLKKLDTENPEMIDRELRKIQEDKYVKGILYKPLETYNKQVREMASDFSVEHPNWQSSIPLNKRWSLVIYGLNSVLTSSHKDHLDSDGKKLTCGENFMVINRKQLPNVQENVVYMSLCHHPPECWNNKELQKRMDARVKIQLYGHKHIQRIDADTNRIRISTGALQPERGEGWIPKYNWLQIYVEENTLKVIIYPRVFNDVLGCFEADVSSCDSGEICKIITLSLEQENINPKVNIIPEEENVDSEVRVTTAVTKEIVYRYIIRSKDDKKAILRKFPELNFKENQDIGILLKELQEKQIQEKFLESLRRG